MSQVFSDNILYYSPGSVFSNIAILLLCEKGIQDQFEFRPLQMGVDNIAPWYIQLNPKGQVPTLIHSGKAIPDSLNIARHIDECFGISPVLSTRDTNVLSIVERWRQVRVLSLVAGKKTETQDVNALEDTLRESRQNLIQNIKEHPELEEQYKVRLIIHDDRTKILIDYDTHLLQKARLVSLFDELEFNLQENNGHLLPNKTRSVADIYVTGILYWLISKFDKDILKDTPIIRSYYLKQSSRPSFIRAFV
ncbi:hypothetical protein BDF21DRAFT_495704 [Thamnidium elegans]|uniref:GST N-terminal domain-containing protein n=1 Tax=Thamnidium elegans TaxID=101142 RepID=A0A8H7SQ43_9FUNG|nr:hypothetical protein INT48_007413 [Thamnidium elegans]KAI8072119.1 hypothetical protein BDF21DRAFT_495704 [Thamnidium elegans]